MKYPRIVSYVCDQPWAILESKLHAITEFIELYANGFRLSPAEIEARTGGRRTSAGGKQAGAVAIVPIFGVISHRANMFSDISGGTSTEMLTQDIRQLAQDDSIETIILDIDSAGGSTEGVTELWKVIYEARQQKNIVAVANAMAASAAYWLGSAATEFVVTPSGSVGSIGVFHLHADESKMLEDAGIKLTITKAGKYKTEGNSSEPLDEDAKDFIQSRVDEAYSMFVRDVAKGRGVKVSEVRNGFGEGRMLGAKEAKEQGMIDRIATLDETLGRLTSKGSKPVMMAIEPTKMMSADIDFRRRRARARENSKK
jgi:signal peptide peptidase SppA